MFMARFRIVIYPVALALITAFAAGCATNVPFDLFQEGYKPKGKSLAVISGSSDDADIRFAEHVTKKLQEMSTLKVLSQQEVERRVGKYPANIKITEPKDKDKPVWYAAGEKAKIDSLHGAVKTDYLLVVWVTNVNRIVTRDSRGGGSVSYGAGFVSNLVEYSPGKAVGYSEFGRSKRQSCFLFGGSEGKDIDNLLLSSAEDLADDLVDRTATRKK